MAIVEMTMQDSSGLCAAPQVQLDPVVLNEVVRHYPKPRQTVAAAQTMLYCDGVGDAVRRSPKHFCHRYVVAFLEQPFSQPEEAIGYFKMLRFSHSVASSAGTTTERQRTREPKVVLGQCRPDA